MVLYLCSSTLQTVQAVAAQTGNRRLAGLVIARGKGSHVLCWHGQIQVGVSAAGGLFLRCLLSAADSVLVLISFHHTPDYGTYPSSV